MMEGLRELMDPPKRLLFIQNAQCLLREINILALIYQKLWEAQAVTHEVLRP